jgi:hypothetical protein
MFRAKYFIYLMQISTSFANTKWNKLLHMNLTSYIYQTILKVIFYD